MSGARRESRTRFAAALLTGLALGLNLAPAHSVYAQGAINTPQQQQRDQAQKHQSKEQEKIAKNADVVINGATSFKDEELRSHLKEQITAIAELGLTPARADDAAFLLELFYRKNGYDKAEVRYTISGSRLRLDVEEGPHFTVGNVQFVGAEHFTADKLFEFFIGPTRERYGKTAKTLPFVRNDLTEGIDLVRRLYISDGYLNVIVQEPHYAFGATGEVNITVAIVEGRQYFFGNVDFSGNTVYGADQLRQEMDDLLREPYTDRRVADIPRRLQTYFKARGYYDVKVDATGNPAGASGGRVPVRVTISPGVVYYFDGSTVTGLQKLRPSYVTKRFRKLSGKKYNPDLVDDKFREMMKSGLFNILQIKPVQVNGNELRLDITAEEAKSKEFGFSLGYGSFVGLIVGASYRDRDLFGYGRPLTTSAEYSSRGYKTDILYEDPYLFDTEIHLKARLSALTYDFDGYSKFEVGGRIDLERELTKQYTVAAVLSARHVEVTSADIAPEFLGRTSYEVNSIGYTQRLDLRKSPLVSPRGFVFDQTLDFADGALGSQIDFVRATGRVSYYLSFAKEKKVVEVNTGYEDEETSWERWFRRTMLAFGARAGVIESTGDSGIPIDERFFNGGGTTVRSFGERDLGPHDHGDPIGGEYYSVFNAEYTFPIWGELQLAVFADAGNLLPNASDAGFDDMRYAIGLGLRYQLPIGPLRIDYGVNPDRRDYEDFGAFHFSFGFAF
jgi:outer membrane protein insertion porin family